MIDKEAIKMIEIERRMEGWKAVRLTNLTEEANLPFESTQIAITSLD